MKTRGLLMRVLWGGVIVAVAGCASRAASGPQDAGAAAPPKAPPSAAIAPVDGTLRIWTIGDSITEGPNGSYRNALYRGLQADGLKVDLVGSLHDRWAEIDDKDHEGHAGYSIHGVWDEGDKWLSKIPRPDVVLIMLGTNDIAWWYPEKPAETAKKLMKAVDWVRKKLPAAVIVVGTIPPESSKLTEPNKVDRAEMCRQYNQELKKAVTADPQSGQRLFLADVNARLKVTDLADGIHPNRPACDKMAEAWLEVLRPLVEK